MATDCSRIVTPNAARGADRSRPAAVLGWGEPLSAPAMRTGMTPHEVAILDLEERVQRLEGLVATLMSERGDA